VALIGGVLAAPLNHLGMLTDYAPPEQRFVACPNQDVKTERLLSMKIY